MIELKPYNYENRLGRCTSRDEYGNADVKGVDMSFMLGLPYEEMAILAQALNRLADFEDAEIAEDKKLREKSNKKMNDDLISRQAAIDALRDAENHAFNSYYRGLKEAHEIIADLPSAQPEPTYCHYCYEDSDGFVYALEKNGHIVIHGNKLMLAAKGWRGEIDIKYCPMCGRRLER